MKLTNDERSLIEQAYESPRMSVVGAVEYILTIRLREALDDAADAVSDAAAQGLGLGAAERAVRRLRDEVQS